MPLSSQNEAEKAVAAAVRQHDATADTEEDSSDAESTTDDLNDVHSTPDVQEAPSPADNARSQSERDDTTAATNIAEDVFTRQGRYGKLASQWLTRKGWGLPGMAAPANIAALTSGPKQPPNPTSIHEPPVTSIGVASPPPTGDSNAEQATESANIGPDENETSHLEKDTTVPLLPKLLRSTRLILSSRSFYFSYDINITRRMGDPQMLTGKSLGHENIDPLVRMLGILSFTLGLLKVIVLLEPKPGLSIYECGFSSVSDAYHARLCGSAPIHGQKELPEANAYRSIHLVTECFKGR